jgi:hypothetical protein
MKSSVMQPHRRRASDRVAVVERVQAKTDGRWGIFVYVAAVLAATGLLFGIAVAQCHSTELFPYPAPHELVRFVQWIWEGPYASANPQ